MKTGLLYYLILFPAVYLGIVTSIQDWQQGKIYNRHIVAGLGIGLGWLLLVILFHAIYIDGWDLLIRVGPKVLLTVLLSLVVSFIMWWMNVWAAADAKMFTVYVLMLPLILYYDHRLGYLVALTMLVNAYVIAFGYILLDFIHRLGRILYDLAKRKLAGGRSGIDWPVVKEKVRTNFVSSIKVFFGFVFLLVSVRMFRRNIQDELQPIVSLDNTTLFLILFLMFHPLYSLLQNVYIFIVAVLGVGGYLGYVLYLDPSGATAWHMVNMGVISVTVIAFRHLYVYWSSLVEVRSIPIEDFQPRMYVSQKTQEWFRDKQIFSDDEVKEFTIDGVSDEQWRRVVEAYHAEDMPDTIEVENTMPFAPFLFLGMIVTAVFHDVIVRFGR